MDESFKKGVKNPESEEGLFWEEWIAKHPDKKEQVNVARQVILFMNFETHYLSKNDVNNLWEKLDRRIEEREQTAIPKVHSYMKPSFQIFSNWYKVAAVFIGLLILSASLFLILQDNGTIQYNTQYGETKTLLLPDSSSVILNANSTLTYSSGWNSGKLREVWLEGEAFFSVVHTANDQKFIVNASNLNVEVLGTEFNVNNRRGETIVVLNSGKVKLSLPALRTYEQTDKKPREIFMKPGELVEYSKDNNKITKKVVDTERYISWKDNLLIFEDTPLSEIIRVLEDNYGLQVIVEDSALVNRKFSATYPADDIDILLKALSKSFRMKISSKENQVIFEDNDQ
jgi:ferric-dicitrate binding protein FerR (iron transport regulator)